MACIRCSPRRDTKETYAMKCVSKGYIVKMGGALSFVVSILAPRTVSCRVVCHRHAAEHLKREEHSHDDQFFLCHQAVRSWAAFGMISRPDVITSESMSRLDSGVLQREPDTVLPS